LPCAELARTPKVGVVPERLIGATAGLQGAFLTHKDVGMQPFTELQPATIFATMTGTRDRTLRILQP
jgi:hypothetical protein